MIPRIRGNVGTFEEGPDKGKWAFEMWLTDFGGGKGHSLGTYGPFETEEKAHQELKRAAQIACQTAFKTVKGADHNSKRYVDLKTNETHEWTE